MTNSKKESQFLTKNAIEGGDFLTGFSGNTNYNFSFSTLYNAFSGLGTFTSIGDGTPVLNQPVVGENEIREIEDGAGIRVSISPNDGIRVDWNVTQNVTGIPIIDDVTASKPVVSSIVAGTGAIISKSNDTITISFDTNQASTLDKRKIVKEASDLAGTLDSTSEYFIDGVIDMGATEIEVPAGGLHLTGFNFDTSKLISSEAGYTMFTSPAGGSGNVIGRDYAIEVTGAGSKVYDLTSATGFDAFEFSRINYNDCTSLGEIDGYRQGLESGTGRFGGTPELTLSGTWLGGFFIDTSIVRSLTDGAYSLFKAGAGFTMNSRFRSNQNIDLNSTVSFFDFNASHFPNPSTLQLEKCLISRNGVFDGSDTTITPNITASELPCSWVGNTGIRNTFVGGELTITTEVATVVSAASTYYDIAGTWTTSDLQHFDEPANGQLRHLGTSPVEYNIHGELVLDSTANDELNIKVVVFRSASSTFEDGRIFRRVVNNFLGGRDAAILALSDNIVLNQNDYVKLQVSNETGANNITAELDSYFFVSER